MEAASVKQIQKRLYRNNTGGWVGVVTLDHKGEETGLSVEPFGTVWLSDAEVILTARAPRRPEDNPFEQQTFVTQDPETGRRSEVLVRPLEPAPAGTATASDRYVPSGVDDFEGRALAAGAALGDEPENVTQGAAVANRTSAVEEEGTDRPVPPVRQTRAAEAPTTTPPVAGATPAPEPPAPAAAPTPPAPRPQGAPSFATPPTGEPESEGESWTEPPPAPGEVLTGSLAGEDASTAADVDPTAPQPGDSVQPTAQAAPQQPGAEEEHAARVDPSVGEETGQAQPPAGEQAEGEYASREEVGSPDAPKADDGPTPVAP